MKHTDKEYLNWLKMIIIDLAFAMKEYQTKYRGLKPIPSLTIRNDIELKDQIVNAQKLINELCYFLDAYAYEYGQLPNVKKLFDMLERKDLLPEPFTLS